MEAVAKLRNVPTAPRKMRLVVDSIRGMDVYQALNVLKFSRKECSRKLEKLLLSAISNWENKHEQSPEDSGLYIKAAYVDGGRTLKRFRPAPMGRATRIRKRSNHVTMILSSKSAVQNDGLSEENNDEQ